MLFSNLTYRFVSYRVYNTCLIYDSCSSFVCKYIKILLKYIITKIFKYFLNTLLINAWKVTRALIYSKNITKYLKYL